MNYERCGDEASRRIAPEHAPPPNRKGAACCRNVMSATERCYLFMGICAPRTGQWRDWCRGAGTRRGDPARLSDDKISAFPTQLRERLSMKKMTKITAGVALAIAAGLSGAAQASGGYTFPGFSGA